MLDQYIPVLIQLGIATGFAVSTLLVSVLLGKSAKSNQIKDSAYECGMLPIGEAKPRFSVKFYVFRNTPNILFLVKTDFRSSLSP